jgi:hypothetical protein
MQPRPFEEWIEKGHQRDANLCGAYARPVPTVANELVCLRVEFLMKTDSGYLYERFW